jgi:hypothetical protein
MTNTRFACMLACGILLVAASRAMAASPCYFLSVPCDANSASSTISGGAYPSFADMFNLNPASIPTLPTPIGVEVIASNTLGTSKTDVNLALIKGYDRAGAALSTNSDRTFYTYNLAQALQGNNYQNDVQDMLASQSIMPTVNLGGALALVIERVSRYSVPTLGVNLKYNRATQGFDYGAGTSINSKHLSMGVSYTRNSAFSGMAGTTTTVTSLGFKYKVLNVDFTMIYYRSLDETLATFSVFSHPAQIATATLNLTQLLLTVAYRRVVTIASDQLEMMHVSVQYKASKHLSISYLYNYIPGTQSLGMQLLDRKSVV